MSIKQRQRGQRIPSCIPDYLFPSLNLNIGYHRKHRLAVGEKGSELVETLFLSTLVDVWIGVCSNLHVFRLSVRHNTR